MKGEAANFDTPTLEQIGETCIKYNQSRRRQIVMGQVEGNLKKFAQIENKFMKHDKLAEI